MDEHVEKAKRTIVALLNSIEPNPSEPHLVTVEAFDKWSYLARAWTAKRGEFARCVADGNADVAVRGLAFQIAIGLEMGL